MGAYPRTHAVPSARVRGLDNALGDVKVADLGWLLVFNVLLFSPALKDSLPLSTYTDEVVTLLLFFAVVAKLVRTHARTLLTVGERRAAACALLFVVVTLVGNAAAGVQTDWKPVLTDLFTCVKFIVALLGALVVFRDNEGAFVAVQAEAKLFVLVCFACALPTVLFGGAFANSDVRYGLYSFQFIYGHPTNVNAVMVACLCLLTTNCRRNRLWINLALVVMACTLRSKGIGAAAFVFLLAQTVGRGRKMTKAYILLAALVVVYLGWGQLSNYYTGEGYARPELTRASFEIANDYLPLGAGFATFGSAVTAEPAYYSTLYYAYGVSGIWGLNLSHATMLSDAFWPILLGQSGYLGTALYSLALVFLAVSGLRSRRAFVPVACCFGYLLISSTAESAFFNPMSIVIAMCAGLAISHSGQLTLFSKESPRK